MNNKTIQLGHGSGGRLSHELIKNLFYKNFKNPILDNQSDSALLELNSSLVAYTTDSYVVDPIFFKGGNIGKLAVCGTINDLAVSGAVPKFLSTGFIIEEGLSFEDLESIVTTMAEEAQKAGITIVTGDTKVVNKGQCDKIFINTSGIGLLDEKYKHISTGQQIKSGDKIIINGGIADHGMTIMAARNFGNFNTTIESDCASLNHLIQEVLNAGCHVKFMRDATRGGIATVLCELAENKHFGIEILEEKVLVKENVRGICELLGFDPFYVANEGKVIMVIAENDAEKALQILQKNELGKDASIIGSIVENHPGKTILQTGIGGKRIIDMLAGEQLPRIC
ncbi:MAG: hydrogenase expression/formation protein HypE [Bacteroidales bacterium]|jgi:hydrogenase expression/formation protein HypE|nr:hydrogenase expression/formation protein HypE [Bacteroidales bacterium]MDD4213561.1 hydrogenase expression/formation protein HypE [Bacteroidales bacterium]